MRLAKKLTSITLAILFCLGSVVLPCNNELTVYAEETFNHTVRVGMFADTTTDSRVFSAKTECESGFELGYSTGKGFIPAFSIRNTTITILPQRDANFENGNCTSKKGNISAYSDFVSHHKNYSSAASKAKSVGGFVAITDTGFDVRIQSESGKLGGNAFGLTILDESGRIILAFEGSGNRFALRGKNGATVSFPMLHRSGVFNTYSYRGFFEYTVEDGKLFMVNCIDIEDYTKSVMSNEIGTNVSKETRKAFSVLARTVPLYAKHSKLGFDVCTHSACCQVYKGLYRISEENNAIVDSTKGLYCAYNGEPIMVLYHNSNGGASCSSVAAWGGTEIPYLTTVFLDEEGESDKWERSFTKQEFYEYLRSRSAFSSLKDDEITMSILETDPYGSDYITILSVSDGSGNTIEIRDSEDVRSACGFNSANFDFEYTAEATVLTANGVETKEVGGVLTAEGFKEFQGFGDDVKTIYGDSFGADKILINGQGAGHGVGFSAVGSEKLAADGYSYEYILTFYFNGTKLLKIN